MDHLCIDIVLVGSCHLGIRKEFLGHQVICLGLALLVFSRLFGTVRWYRLQIVVSRLVLVDLLGDPADSIVLLLAVLRCVLNHHFIVTALQKRARVLILTHMILSLPFTHSYWR